MNTKWRHFRYIPHHRTEEYERLGWEITNDLAGTHHGDHSVLGVWTGGENDVPPEPMPVLRGDSEKHKAMP